MQSETLRHELPVSVFLLRATISHVRRTCRVATPATPQMSVQRETARGVYVAVAPTYEVEVRGRQMKVCLTVILT